MLSDVCSSLVYVPYEIQRAELVENIHNLCIYVVYAPCKLPKGYLFIIQIF